MPVKSDRESAIEIIRDIFGFPVTGDYWWVSAPVRTAEELYKMTENTNAVVRSSGESLIWEEWITNNFENQYLIQIIAKPGYPFAMPKVFVPHPKIEIDAKAHIHYDRSICVFHAEDYSPHMSILEIRNQACTWTWCYDVYKNTGEWPAAERPHDDDD